MSDNNKIAVLSFSGGLDSTSLLLKLLVNNYIITAISFVYGQNHDIEVEHASNLISYLFKKGFNIRHKIIRLSGLSDLLDSTLINTKDIPIGHYHERNMVKTVVPNRNKIFSSIIQAVALSISKTKGSDVIMALGVHSGDHHIYPDCRLDFYNKDYKAFLSGNYDANRVKYFHPYMNFDKTYILKDGIKSCYTLNLNYEDIYSMTFTSYIPIKYKNRIYSDYKSASSIERIEAFINLKLVDPIDYADDSGPVTWTVAKNYVMKKLKSFNNFK